MQPPSGLAAALASPSSLAVAAAATTMPALAAAAPPGECRLLGPFALLVQAALGALALLSLVFKRWRECPQRPVKTWFFDVSKQVFGSVLVHGANVFMSMLTSGRFSIRLEHRAPGAAADDPYEPNPCSLYLLNLAIDVSFFFFEMSPCSLPAVLCPLF